MRLTKLRRAGINDNGAGRTYRYSAFISYSRAIDAELATALQASLQKFAKPWYKPRSLRIFRDDASLSANPDLWASVQDALHNSEFFILMASATSAQSPWVNREVEYWLSERPVDTILLTVTEGELPKAPVTREVIWSEVKILPPALKGRYRRSPRYVDLRWVRATKGPRNIAQLNIRNASFLENVADLAATLHHRPKEEIAGEEVRQHRRTMRLARAAVVLLAALAIAASGAAVIAYTQRQEALHQLNVATSRQLAAQADLASATDPQLAALLSVAAFDIYDTGDARTALARRLQQNTHINSFFGDPGNGSVLAVRLDDKTHTVLAIYRGGRAIRWNLYTRRKLLDVHLKGGGPYDYSVSPDGRRVAFSAGDNTNVEDIASGAVIARIPGTFGQAIFSPDGSSLAVASKRSNQSAEVNAPFLLWNINRNSLIGKSDNDAGYMPLAFSADGSMLALGAGVHADTSNLAVYEVPTMKLVRVLHNGHDRGVSSAAFSPDGSRLATGGHDSRIEVWSLLHDTPLESIQAKGDVNSVKFSTDGTTLFSGDGARNITAWNVEHGTATLRLTGHTAAVTDLQVGSDGRTLVSAGDDSRIGVWDILGRDQLALQRLPFDAYPLAFEPNQNKLAAVPVQGERIIIIIDLASGRVLEKYPFGVLAPDWSKLYIGPAQSVPTSRPPRPAIGQVVKLRYNPLAVSPDGRLLLVSDNNNDTYIAHTGSILSELIATRSISSVAFRDDDRVLASGASDAINIIDTSSGRTIWSLPGHNPAGVVQGVAFNTDGSMLASLALDSAQTARGCAGCNVILWDMGRRVELATLIGHTSEPVAVKFSPDSQLLASSSDAEVILWSIEQRAPIAKLEAGGGIIFSPDKKFLATQVGSAEIQIWDVDPASWRSRLCSITGRSLTKQEWASYLPGRAYNPQCGS